RGRRRGGVVGDDRDHRLDAAAVVVDEGLVERRPDLPGARARRGQARPLGGGARGVEGGEEERVLVAGPGGARDPGAAGAGGAGATTKPSRTTRGRRAWSASGPQTSAQGACCRWRLQPVRRR